jgi:hypothetical protein
LISIEKVAESESEDEAGDEPGDEPEDVADDGLEETPVGEADAENTNPGPTDEDQQPQEGSTDPE